MKRLASEIITALLVLLFLYTAIMKLKSISGFAGSLEHSPALYKMAHVLAVAVPSTELLSVMLLILPATRQAGLLASAIMMTIFTGYIGYMLATSSQLPCTCGGVIEAMTWRQHFVFNLIFTLLSTLGYLFSKNLVATNRRSRTPVK